MKLEQAAANVTARIAEDLAGRGVACPEEVAARMVAPAIARVPGAPQPTESPAVEMAPMDAAVPTELLFDAENDLRCEIGMPSKSGTYGGVFTYADTGAVADAFDSLRAHQESRA